MSFILIRYKYLFSFQILVRNTVVHTSMLLYLLCLCHIQYIAFLSGTRLWNFDITVGPYNGQYWKCGSSSNYMDTGETASFTCDPNAKGTSLKITIKDRRELLTLCEVLVFGIGMTCSNFNQPRSNHKQPLPFYCVVVVLPLAYLSSGLTLALIYISVVFIFPLSFFTLFLQRSLSAVYVAVDIKVFCLMGMVLACLYKRVR